MGISASFFVLMAGLAIGLVRQHLSRLDRLVDDRKEVIRQALWPEIQARSELLVLIQNLGKPPAKDAPKPSDNKMAPPAKK